MTETQFSQEFEGLWDIAVEANKKKYTFEEFTDKWRKKAEELYLAGKDGEFMELGFTMQRNFYERGVIEHNKELEKLCRERGFSVRPLVYGADNPLVTDWNMAEDFFVKPIWRVSKLIDDIRDTPKWIYFDDFCPEYTTHARYNPNWGKGPIDNWEEGEGWLVRDKKSLELLNEKPTKDINEVFRLMEENRKRVKGEK